MRRAAAAVALVGAIGGAGVGSPAWGFTRDKTEDGIPVYWTTSCVSTTVYTYGFSMMTPDAIAKSIGAAAHTWSPSTVTCTDGSHP